MMKRIIFVSIKFLFLLGMWSNSFSEDVTNRQILEKQERKELLKENDTLLPYPPQKILTVGAIRVYQLLIAPSKGSICPMEPHCSLYAQMAFVEHNPVQAFVMTADRLHRCGHDLNNYNLIEFGDSIRFYDPPSGSDIISQVEPINTSPPTFILQESDELKEDSRIFSFAEILFKNQNFEAALIEYQRLIFYFPNSSFKTMASKRILQCYYQSKKYLEAIHWGEEMLKQDEDLETNFYMGLSFFHLKNFPKARNQFQIVSANDNGVLKDKALLLLGLSCVQEEKWDEAKIYFGKLSPESGFYKKAEELKGLAEKGPFIKQKNPIIAGSLAIIPGLGYLYNGYKQTAISSFIVNGLFFWGTVEAFKNDNDALKLMMGILSFGWYGGNIYGSIITTQRKNKRIKSDFLTQFNVGFDF